MSNFKRVIPPQLNPVINQALLNLAVEGCSVVDDGGIDCTALLKSQAPEINLAYETWLNAKRQVESISNEDRQAWALPKPYSRPRPPAK